ncbi:hypothetical protein PRIPAC_94165 [Pristionchus pacificus]|uniref:ShK domain-containing protein n=1 Tax=Pristionchus pacificus TaxID=54126 RepID=A0A2A6CHD6_PRIPA|nr:hypothetical protein PRIPAC_94165 [Pristionchus pacificus]|eukprot:PDM77500.1 ShK domain-containing protein [Pristionchus pacificus]
MLSTNLLVICAVVAAVNAQCGSPDDARCSTWVQGGFCNSEYYTLDYRKKTCGLACGLCPPANCAGTTENANCATWKANGFCTNAFYTNAQKHMYCCRACGI